MSEYKTLQEIHNTLGITRCAIQGYEKMGLVRASDKNKYGYLLYGENELRRIEKIKMYQEFGLKLKEIKELIDAPNHIVKAALERQVEKLKKEQEKLNTLISQAEAVIKELNKEQQQEAQYEKDYYDAGYNVYDFIFGGMWKQ